MPAMQNLRQLDSSSHQVVQEQFRLQQVGQVGSGGELVAPLTHQAVVPVQQVIVVRTKLSAMVLVRPHQRRWPNSHLHQGLRLRTSMMSAWLMGTIIIYNTYYNIRILEVVLQLVPVVFNLDSNNRGKCGKQIAFI
jgi:hypothetical protein